MNKSGQGALYCGHFGQVRSGQVRSGQFDWNSQRKAPKRPRRMQRGSRRPSLCVCCSCQGAKSKDGKLQYNAKAHKRRADRVGCEFVVNGNLNNQQPKWCQTNHGIRTKTNQQSHPLPTKVHRYSTDKILHHTSKLIL